MGDELSDRDRLFFTLYTTPGQRCYLNLTRAGTAAGYGKGEQQEFARQHASRKRNEPGPVKDAIDGALKEAEDNLKDLALKALQHTARQATADIGQIFDEDGGLRRIQDLPRAVRHAIARIETEEIFEGTGAERRKVGVVRKVWLHDKKASQELLAKFAGKLKEKVQVEGTLSVPELILSADKMRREREEAKPA